MTKKNKDLILWLKDIRIKDIALVGGKNAALGEMFSHLTPLGIDVANGFAITAYAYRKFIKEVKLEKKFRSILQDLDTHNIQNLRDRGKKIRELILQAEFPETLTGEITKAYKELGGNVAVRSSATAEDLPGASFAGQQETYLNVTGEKDLLMYTKKVMASLFTDRAISYRRDKGFPQLDIAISVGVQTMVRSDLASSGVAFTIDTQTGFDKVVIINGSYGVGELVVQGKVIPDEYIVFKPTLKEKYNSIISKERGKKAIKLVYGQKGLKKVLVKEKDRLTFCLTDKEILQLAEWCVQIETYFKKPMDIEWAKDGKTNSLFITQARPETVHAHKTKTSYEEYGLEKKAKPVLQGAAIGTKIAAGKVHIIKGTKDMEQFQKGEVLVTETTDPDWEPIMKIAAAVVTDKGGRTSHAAIVARELGIPAIVGTESATKIFKNNEKVTVDCSSGKIGFILKGILPFKTITHKLQKIPKTKTQVMINIGAPEEAFKNAFLPVRGVGLGRLEFIISSQIKIHPRAFIDFPKGDSKVVKHIAKIAPEYKDKKQYYVDKLAEGIAKIGAAFWPHKVIIRFSDFKTNEYRELIGGEYYEPEESNPMLGWRGTSRYLDPAFKEAFHLECLSMKKVRDEMGLKNITPMIPFCRTIREGKEVIALMKTYGLDRDKEKGLNIIMMCEIPSNVILVDEFLDIFDGMSIGSNDLTQLILGLDRDSEIISKIGNENNAAVKKQIAKVIAACKKRKKYVGICGQAPSDYPEFTRFLVENNIDSISLNPDAVMKTLLRIAKYEY